MKNRVLWLILSCLMVIALVLASCAPAVKPTAPTMPTTPTTPTAPTTPTTPTMPTTPAKPVTIEKPGYGGTITITIPSFRSFDTYRWDSDSNKIISFAAEKLATTDWAVDRNLYSFSKSWGFIAEKYMVGQLLESWETPAPLTIILHVRQGVHFHDKPPVNGREFTADDVVWNLERYRVCPFIDRAQMDNIESVNKKDKWTVELRLKPPPVVGAVRGIFDVGGLLFYPKEAVGKSGTIEDWHNIIATGPFMIEDCVPDSCVTFKRSPNYWGYDERHPEYRLPYADFAKVLLIADPSTKYAALRTGKLDWLPEFTWTDAESLLRSAPRLLSRGVPFGTPKLFRMRYDTAPFNDVRVRQAMNMALDRSEIIKSFYGGHGSWYIPSLEQSAGLYTPYEKLPDKPMWTTASCKEVLTYDPKRAKELLAEAGYPKGFKTHIDTTPTRDLGLSELLQFYLAKIGVEAQINMMEAGTYDAKRLGKQCTQIILHWISMNPDPFYAFMWVNEPGHPYNLGCVNDKYFQDLYYKAKSEFDTAKREKMLVEMEYRAIEMAFSIVTPHPEEIVVWQPWLKGYAGEGCLALSHPGSLWARVWVDQELKKSLGF